MADNLPIVSVLRDVARVVGSVTPSSRGSSDITGALDAVLARFVNRSASNESGQPPAAKKRKRSQNRSASLSGMLPTVRKEPPAATNNGSGKRKKSTKINLSL